MQPFAERTLQPDFLGTFWIYAQKSFVEHEGVATERTDDKPPSRTFRGLFFFARAALHFQRWLIALCIRFHR